MDIVEKITGLGFELDSYSNGKHECICPFCSHTRKPIHQKQKCAAVWVEDDFATYNCIHCGEHGFLHSDKPSKKQTYERPVVRQHDDDKLVLATEFFQGRGIRLETARKFGVYVETEKFRVPVLAFPYYKGGQLVNVKYRGLKEKTFAQEKNPEPVVFGYDKCFGQKEIIIVEGECDLLAFAEVGIENVVSIPSGSIGQPVDKDYKGAKFDFLKVSQPLFDIADRVILALDSDAPGQYMTQALIDRLGKEKCWLVDWGQYKVKGKDANDFLLVDKSILPDAIANAKPVPLRGIVNAGDDMDVFEDYIKEGINGAITTGFDNLDELIKFEYGNFVTITGYPGCLSWNTRIRINREHHGKTVTIKDLYQRFNGLDPRYKWKDSPTHIRRYINGRIVLSKVEAVTYSGIKPTMELVLDDGKTLRATPDHRILTVDGYKQLQTLTTDDLVIVDNLKQGIPDVARVVSVCVAGIGPTYDIQCADIPGNEPNFNANGIMVHNSGKSLFATDLIMNLAEIHNMKTLYCAFENTPNQLKKKWLQMKIGRSVMNADEATVDEVRKHYQFLRDHFFILQDITTTLTVDEILDMAQQAIRRYNIGCVIIDPLNKLTFNKSSNFTEDIGELLTKLIIFAKRNGVLMFLVAHPTKPADGQRKLGAQSTPSGFDIAGSANFLNMSDVIMTVHRKQDEFGNKSRTVRVLISKVRDTDFGHEGSCYFVYNPSTGRYFPTTSDEFEHENLDPTIRTKQWLDDV